MSNKISFVLGSDIPAAEWNQLIYDAPNGMIYAYSWYMDMIADDWAAIVYGDYEVVLPLVIGKKYGISYIYPPKWCQQLGFISIDKVSSIIVHEMLNAIPAQFKLVELILNSANPKVEQGNVTWNKNYELPLNDSYENIKNKYSSQIKRNLKKAEKNQLSFFENDRPENLIELFRLHKGKDLKHLQESDYIALKHIMYACIHKGVGKVCSVYGDKNDLLASAFFLSYYERSVFLFSGVNSFGKQFGAMSFLIDKYLKPFADQDHILDFEGSNDKNLARFYAGFGSEEFQYQTVRINRLPWPIRLLKN
jgi:hypothetical protein